MQKLNSFMSSMELLYSYKAIAVSPCCVLCKYLTLMKTLLYLRKKISNFCHPHHHKLHFGSTYFCFSASYYISFLLYYFLFLLKFYPISFYTISVIHLPMLVTTFIFRKICISKCRLLQLFNILLCKRSFQFIFLFTKLLTYSFRFLFF